MRSMRTIGVLLLLSPLLLAAQKPLFVAGTFVDVQEKTTTRILYYQVDTPITREDPYYEVSVQINDTVYSGRYTPMHSADTMPEDWRAGAAVEARIDGKHLILKRPGGADMSFAFTKRPVKREPGSSAVVPAGK